MYNTTLNACVSCPPGYTYNSNNHTCTGTSNSGSSSGSSSNSSSSSNTNTSTTTSSCPSGAYWDGVKCVTCYLPNYWDLNSRSCKSCPAGTNYDTKQLRCVVC